MRAYPPKVIAAGLLETARWNSAEEASRQLAERDIRVSGSALRRWRQRYPETFARAQQQVRDEARAKWKAHYAQPEVQARLQALARVEAEKMARPYIEQTNAVIENLRATFAEIDERREAKKKKSKKRSFLYSDEIPYTGD